MTRPWLIASLLIGGLAVIAGVSQLASFDLFWHLKIGQIAVEQHTSLPRDIFSIHFEGQPWLYKDLGADLLLYLGYHTFGPAWLALLKTMAAAAIGVALVVLGRSVKASPTVVLLGVALALGVVASRLVARPLLFSLIGFPLMLTALHRVRERGSSTEVKTLIRVWLVPVLLQWAWVCLHRAAMLGYVLMATVCLEQVVGYLVRRRPSMRLWFPLQTSKQGIAVGCSALVSAVALGFVNPSGGHFFATSINVAASEMLRRYVSEWAVLTPAEILLEFPLVALLFGLAVIALVGQVLPAARRAAGRSTVGFAQAGLLVLFAVLSLTDGVRWFVYLSIQAAVILVQTSPIWTVALPAGVLRRRPRGLLLLIAVVGALLIFTFKHRPWGWAEQPDRFPAGAVAFARQHGLGRAVINGFHLGGYLIWSLGPQTKVLIDGRTDTVYPPSFTEAVIRSQTDPAFFARRFSGAADWVVASNIPGELSHAFLSEDPEWMLVYWSEPAVIYVKRRAYPSLVAERFQWIDPARIDFSVAQVVQHYSTDPAILKHLRHELSRMYRASPKSLRANTALAVYCHLRGPKFWPERDQLLSFLQLHYGHHPAVAELTRRFTGS